LPAGLHCYRQALTDVVNAKKCKRNNEKIQFHQNYTKEMYPLEIPYTIKSTKKLTAALAHLAIAGPYAIDCNKKKSHSLM
jgi:hypothetical protein